MKPQRNSFGFITPDQITAIKMGQKALGIDDETYRAILDTRYGVTSCKDLSREQAADLIEDFIRKGFTLVQSDAKAKRQTTYQPRPKSGNKVIHLASRAELDKIEALIPLVCWQFDDGYERWLKKRFGIDKVKTAGEAYRVIEGLKKMFENYMKKEHGPNWWLLTFNSPSIREYIARHCPEEFRK